MEAFRAVVKETGHGDVLAVPGPRSAAGVPSPAGTPSGDPGVADALRILAAVGVAGDGAGMIDQLRQLEDVKSLAAAKQAEITVAFDLQQRREQDAAGVPASEQGCRDRGAGGVGAA